MYVVTVGVCTRSGAQEIEILKKKSQVSAWEKCTFLLYFLYSNDILLLLQTVFASPSYRPMNSKGTQETIVYPHVVFPIDNFEDVSLKFLALCPVERYLV